MSLTVREKEELIASMSAAWYALGSIANLYTLKCQGESFGKEHDRKCWTRELWVSAKREIRA